MPFIVAWGDKLRPAVSDYIGYFPDVMPTLCDIAGVDSPKTDGISFLPTLKARRQPKHEFLYWEFPKFRGGNGWLCVRMGRWKGLVEDVADGNTRMQLYDIVTDVREERDVAAENPQIVAAMWQAIQQSHTDVENPLFRLEIKYPPLK